MLSTLLSMPRTTVKMSVWLNTQWRFQSLRLSCCPKETYGCIWRCAHDRLYNRGDEKFAACSISTATRLSLDDCLYRRNTKHTGMQVRAAIAPFSPYTIKSFTCDMRSCANMLAVILPDGVSPRNCKKSHVKCLIFLSDINPIWISSAEL